jgi:hypothetical protein
MSFLQDPLAAALDRADSQSTPYLNSFTSIPNSSSNLGSSINSPTAAAAAGAAAPGVFDRMRRGGSSSNSSSTAGTAGGVGTHATAAAGQQQQQQSRLSKVSGDDAAAAAADEDAAAAGGVGELSRNDSFSSLATINIRTSEGGAAPGAAAAAGDADAESSSTAAAAAAGMSGAGSLADSASSVAGQGNTQVNCCCLAALLHTLFVSSACGYIVKLSDRYLPSLTPHRLQSRMLQHHHLHHPCYFCIFSTTLLLFQFDVLTLPAGW